MKVLFTLGMVMDLEPEEIPAFADKLEQSGIGSMYAGMEQALDGRELDDEQRAELREMFQIYGVSYSVLHELEIPR